MLPSYNIIYQDDYFFAIDKLAGDFVHPPEASRYPVPREKICLYGLREHFAQEVFPVHRLDAPTSGLVLFGFHKDSTRELSRLFMNREVDKTYHAVVRGFTDEAGEINIPLEIAGFPEPNPSTTKYKRLATIEYDKAVGKKYTTARYSLVEAKPLTGRWHQIRRHFDRISHPILGDIEHGDSHHNRFFRDELKIQGLCLRAIELRFEHPWSKQEVQLKAPVIEKWQRIYKEFKVTP